MPSNVYFISDLHLGSAHNGDATERERRVVSFLDSIADDAAELYLVGDVLDYWYEYRTVVPRGFVRFFGALARLADKGVKITWMIGNHDIWLFDYLSSEIGLEVVDGILEREILGKKFLITHGDGIGSLKRGFKFIRALFRNRLCQTLFASVHPRWTVPLAHRWSAHSRANDVEPAEAAPDDPLRLFAQRTLAADPTIDYFIFGHRHTLTDDPIVIPGAPQSAAPGAPAPPASPSAEEPSAAPAATARMIVLGDWLTHFSYGLFDGRTFTLHTYPA